MFTRFLARFFYQVFGQGFDQVLGEGKHHKYSVQYYWDGKMQCKVLLRRKNILHRLISKKTYLLFFGTRDFHGILAQIFGQIFDQIFGQVFDQIFGGGFDQGFWPPQNTVYSSTGTEKYSVQYYPDRGNQLFTIYSSKS